MPETRMDIDLQRFSASFGMGFEPQSHEPLVFLLVIAINLTVTNDAKDTSKESEAKEGGLPDLAMV